MGFSIPNDVPGGTTEQHAQATPDKVDIDILVAGHNLTGVQSGCAVTAQGSPNMTVAVAVGTVGIAGVAAAVVAGNVTITTADVTNPRFDLVVVNSSGTKSVTAGTPAALPEFPAIPANSAVLAAVYVGAGVTSIGTADIVDKRVILNSTTYASLTSDRHKLDATITKMGLIGQWRTRTKLRGVTLTPQSPGDWGRYWGDQYDATYIASQMQYAAQLGANCVRSYGCPSAVLAGSISRATYLSRWQYWLDTAAQYGMLVYPTLCETGQLASAGGIYTDLTNPTAIANVVAELAALASLLDSYTNVVGIDLLNESMNKLGKTTGFHTWMQALVPAVRAVTVIPITASMIPSSILQVGNGTYELDLTTAVAGFPDFFDYHPYYSTKLVPSVTEFNIAHANYPTMPMVIGEICSVASASAAASGTFITGLQPLAELPYMAGVAVFCLNDYGSPQDVGNAQALFDTSAGIASAWVERTVSTYPYRLLPRGAYQGPQSLPLAVDSSSVTLATSLTTVTGAESSVATADLDVFPNRDPQWRMTAEVSGLSGGDVVTLTAADPANANAALSTASITATGGGATTTADASANARTGTLVGVTLPSPVTGQFSNGLSLASQTVPAYLDFGEWSFTGAALTLECWFKRTRTGAQETLIGKWGTTAASQQALLYITSANKVAAALQKSTGTTAFPTGVTNVTDTNWHHAALTWDGTTSRVFIDGVLDGSAALSGTGLKADDGVTHVLAGAQAGSPVTNGLVGSIDEIRISTTARYTAGFTPSVAAFTTDANTALLAHLDTITYPAGPVVARVSTPWLYAQPAPAYALAQMQNVTAARGKVESLVLEARYA